MKIEHCPGWGRLVGSICVVCNLCRDLFMCASQRFQTNAVTNLGLPFASHPKTKQTRFFAFLLACPRRCSAAVSSMTTHNTQHTQQTPARKKKRRAGSGWLAPCPAPSWFFFSVFLQFRARVRAQCVQLRQNGHLSWRKLCRMQDATDPPGTPKHTLHQKHQNPQKVACALDDTEDIRDDNTSSRWRADRSEVAFVTQWPPFTRGAFQIADALLVLFCPFFFCPLDMIARCPSNHAEEILHVACRTSRHHQCTRQYDTQKNLLSRPHDTQKKRTCKPNQTNNNNNNKNNNNNNKGPFPLHV